MKWDRASTPEARVALGTGVALALLALGMYRPWVERPFDILDFSEFLPFLTGHDGFFSRLWALTSYYTSTHGRLNVASYVALAAKWTLFGARPVLWQWLRVVEMGTIASLVFLLFRRLSVGMIGATAGASLFVVSRVVGEAWTRMTMGEPLGLLCGLGALLVATRWRASARPLRLVIGSGILMAVAVLAKEMLIGLLPLVWLVGVARGQDGRFTWPKLGKREWGWIFWASFPPLAAFAAAVITALGVRSEGFTALYGTPGDRGPVFFQLMAWPWLAEGLIPTWASIRSLGDVALYATTAAGLGLAWRARERRTHLMVAAVAALGLSTALAILYVPWPYFNLYYAIPFLLGPALLFGIAVQRLVEAGVVGRALAGLGWLGVVAGAAPPTARAASMAIAVQQVNGEIVAMLGQAPNADRIVVAQRVVSPQVWMTTGATLRRYALATGAARTLPPGMDLSCSAVNDLGHGGLGRTVLITYLQNCGGIQPSSARIMRHFDYLWIDHHGIGVSPDSVAADILVAPEALAPAPAP